MATAQMDTVIRHLRRAVLQQDGAGRTDGQLLASFVKQKDEAAFAALVRRHGPMVFGVCRRVVRNHHDAEDAFQATFLVLAHKASSLKQPDRLANWLHGVALRTAMKAKTMTTKRRGREKQVTEMPEPEAAQQDQWRDLQHLLDQELNGLPENYRLPILLCDLEGKTIKDAAQQLGWPQGSLAGRLARGRKLLAKRLASRGVVLSAGSLAAVVSQNVASAGVPTSLMSSTVKAAAMIAAGQATVAGTVPAKVAALTEGVLKGMMLTKLSKAAVAGLVVLCLCGLGIGGFQALPAQETKTTTTITKKSASDVKNVLGQLDGTWGLVSNQGDGYEVIGIGKTDTRTLTIKGGRLETKINGKPYQASVVKMIDTSEVPWRVDLQFTEGGEGSMAAIMKVEGDTLKWCQSYGKAARPKEFGTVRGDGLNYSIWKRVKPQVAAKEEQQGSELKEGEGVGRIVTDYFDNLSRNQSVKNLDLFISPNTPVVGISKGSGPDIIWRKTAKELIELEGRQQQVVQTVDAMHVEVSGTLAVAKVKGHNQNIGYQWVFTFTSEGGRWRIAAVVYDTWLPNR